LNDRIEWQVKFYLTNWQVHVSVFAFLSSLTSRWILASLLPIPSHWCTSWCDMKRFDWLNTEASEKRTGQPTSVLRPYLLWWWEK